MISDEGKGKKSKSRHTEAQIIGALKQLEAGRKAEDVAPDKSVLHDILRFVSREPETYQISQQRFA